MTALLYFAILADAVLLGLATFVQTLYLESQRLRTRDLPSLKYFKEELEQKIGLETEAGTAAFSLIKHSLLLLLGILYFGAMPAGMTWMALAEAVVFSWLTMLLMAYALPQVLYRRTGARWVVPLAPLLQAMALMVRPLVALMSFFQSLVELADEKNGGVEPPTSAENIEALITAGEEEGLIEEDDRKLIQSVVEFGDTVVREVMAARPNIVAVPVSTSLEQLRQLVINEQYSRIPVFEENIDQIIGFVHVRDMFELEESEREKRTVRELMRPMRFVPESKPVHDLMREMQRDGTHMVAVIDEYGNTAGLATMEDLVEVILGDIRDEHEPGSDIVMDGEACIVSGSFDLARLDGLFPFRRSEDIESTTIGGLVTEWLGRVPEKGESVERDGIRVEVLASDDHRVEQVRIAKSNGVLP